MGTFRAVCLCLLAGISLCAAADDALQRELGDLLQRYFTAVNSDHVEEALKLRTGSSRAEIEKELANAGNRAATLEMMKAMTPERFEAQYFEAAPAGAEATLYAIVTKTLPEEVAKQQGRATARAEAMVQFRKEGNAWRLDDITFTGDPDKVKRSPDENFEPEEAFNLERRTSISGRVVRTRFEADHSVLIVRVLDEEIVALLPSRKKLEEYGLDFDLVRPWRIVNVRGHPHKSNPLKLLATALEEG